MVWRSSVAVEEWRGDRTTNEYMAKVQRVSVADLTSIENLSNGEAMEE